MTPKTTNNTSSSSKSTSSKTIIFVLVIVFLIVPSLLFYMINSFMDNNNSNNNNNLANSFEDLPDGGEPLISDDEGDYSMSSSSKHKQQRHHFKTSTSQDSSSSSFKICTPLNFELDVINTYSSNDGETETKQQRKLLSTAPTLERSEEIVNYVRGGSEIFLGYGTRVAGATNKGRRRAGRFIRDGLQCVVDQTTTTPTTESQESNEATKPHWKLWQDKFAQNTVLGPTQFTNYILETTNDDTATRHLVIAAHWDSKLFKEFEFLAACDSAVSVVMMIRMARQLAAMLDSMSPSSKRRTNVKYTFMFLDGEEAFIDWKGDDNTYGSRHLAQMYEKNGKLKNITTFMLLDLLGPKNPTFYDYFRNMGDKTSSKQFKKMQKIEQKQRDVDKLRRTAQPNIFFSSLNAPGNVDDDHRPWMQRGVPILHLIPLPFPEHWHKAGDTIETIDFDNTVLDLYNIIVEFILTF